MTLTKDGFPFSAVVGQEEAKLALVLAAVDPSIGGVLLRGDKGSAKSTLARGLAGLLADDAPFVELPVGATEDRVLGSLDLRAALTDGADRFRPGLLAAAHGGVLYVDEVNLLPDHLVDGLLDAAASGMNRVERDGVSHEHPARFVLLGSMNPEEGELRPQLLDRFGLVVDVRTPQDPVLRAEAVRRRIAHDAGGAPPSTDDELRRWLGTVRPAGLPDEIVEFAAQLAVEAGAESLRADLVICRAAAVLAGWESRSAASTDDVRRVAPLALVHRSRRDRSGPGSVRQVERSPGQNDYGGSGGGERSERSWAELAGEALEREPEPLAVAPEARRRTVDTDGPGRVVGDRLPDERGPNGLAVLPTVRAALQRRAVEPDGGLLQPEDLREQQRVRKQGRTVVVAVDTSGSIGTQARVAAATTVVLGLLADAYVNRDQVAMVTFADGTASEVLPPTASVELARTCLADLTTGGTTPLAEGIATALHVASRAKRTGTDPLIVVVTDGRATGESNALEHAYDAADQVADSGFASVVLDAETEGAQLGLAKGLAKRMGARHLPIAHAERLTK